MTRIAAGNVKLKRAYEAATAADGRRILIDRLWPRGVKKADAAIDLWLKDLSPSTELEKMVWPRAGALGGIFPALSGGDRSSPGSAR